MQFQPVRDDTIKLAVGKQGRKKNRKTEKQKNRKTDNYEKTKGNQGGLDPN